MHTILYNVCMKINYEDILSEQILEHARVKQGFVTREFLVKENISGALAAYLVKKGKLERVERGLYSLPDAPSDIFYSQQRRFQKGIYSHGTALYLHHMTDRTPYAVEMTFPLNYNTRNAKEAGVLCSRVNKKIYDLSVVSVETPCGNTVRAYSPERTICDVFKATHGVPSDEEINALKAYLKRPSCNVNLLFSLATTLGVSKTLRPYLEALI